MTVPPDYPTILKPSLAKWGLMLVGLLGLIGGAVMWGFVHPKSWYDTLMGILSIGFGIAGVIVSLAFLFSQRLWLRLTPEGFSFGTLRHRLFYKWTEVDFFEVRKIGANRLTGIVLRSGYVGRRENVRSPNLPDTYGMTPQELAALLNDLKRRFINTSSTDTRETEPPAASR